VGEDHSSGTDSLRSKGDKRHRTRAKLLEAARALIREKGHERTTLEVGRLTGMAFAITDEKMRAHVTQTTAESYAFGEAWLRETVNPEELPMPADHLVRVIHVLTEGLVLQRLLTPELVPDDVIREAFDALVRK
jgi:hypothetical protein